MRRSYVLKNNNDNVIFYNTKAEEVLKNYKSTINGIIKLLSLFTDQKSFYIDLKNIEYTKYEAILELKINAGKEEFIIKINREKVSIEFGTYYYEFTIDWDMDKYYAKLTKYSKILTDRIVSQTFTDSHELTLEIIFKDKHFCLTIPIDISYTLEPKTFNYIKDTSAITDLKKLYLTHFFKKQIPYDQKLGTRISIYDIVGEEEILMDEILVQNGCITKYLLSKRKDNIIISKEGTSPFDGEIKIKNYTINSNIDLNSEVNDLIRRSRSINLDI